MISEIIMTVTSVLLVILTFIKLKEIRKMERQIKNLGPENESMRLQYITAIDHKIFKKQMLIVRPTSEDNYEYLKINNINYLEKLDDGTTFIFTSKKRIYINRPYSSFQKALSDTHSFEEFTEKYLINISNIDSHKGNLIKFKNSKRDIELGQVSKTKKNQ